MIIGRVTAERQAVIVVGIRDPGGRVVSVEGVIDTCFSGFLTLSPDIIITLGLPFVEARYYTLGNGSDVEMRLFRADVVWDDQDKTILVVEADDDALIGMELLEGSTLFIDVRTGGDVRIDVRRTQ